jgi:hypothetical protein
LQQKKKEVSQTNYTKHTSAVDTDIAVAPMTATLNSPSFAFLLGIQGPHALDGSAKIEQVVILRHMLTTVNTEHSHTWFIDQPAEKFGSDEEVLAATSITRWSASDID